MSYNVTMNIYDGHGFTELGCFDDLYSAKQLAIDKMKTLIESYDKVHIKIDGSVNTILYSITINDVEIMTFSKSDEATAAVAILNDAIEKISRESNNIIDNNIKDSITLERVINNQPIAPILYYYSKA